MALVSLLGLVISLLPVAALASEPAQAAQPGAAPGPRPAQQANRPLPPAVSAAATSVVAGQRPAPPVVGASAALPARLAFPDSSYRPLRFPTTTEKWIDVDLSAQQVVAYEGVLPVRAFLVSTGLPRTPTVTGAFRIYGKTPRQDMEGGSRAAGNYYFLRNVPWVQYFYADYSFHGAYWHNNFGYPMSHGCINMAIEDAKWLYEWAGPSPHSAGQPVYWIRSTPEDPGTLVIVHE